MHAKRTGYFLAALALGTVNLAVVGTAIVGSATPALAQQKKTTCASILAICLKRAGDGHAGICEDMHSQAVNSGTWPPTQDEQGKKYAAVPCTK